MRLLKYLLQGFGITLLGAFGLIILASISGSGANDLYNSPLFSLGFLLVPVVYAIIKLSSDNSVQIAASSWRRRFDSDTNATAILQHVRSLNPTTIEFLYEYPPGERPAPQPQPQANPMYPGSAPKPAPAPTFQPQMRLKDAKGKLLQAFIWPYTDVENSMRYFPWWLEHQLDPGQWNIGPLTDVTPGCATNSYTVYETRDGGYSATRDCIESSERRYGTYMRKK